MVYPGKDNIREELVFRSLGEPSRRQRIGCGFMHKAGVIVDEQESYFSSYALVYVIRGRGRYITEQGQEFQIEPGCLFQRHPAVVHSTILEPESHWLECFLDFGEDLYRALLSMRLVFPGEYISWIPPDSGVEEEFYRTMINLKEASERELPHYSMEILQFCASLLERSRKGDEPGWDRIELSCRDFNRMIDQRFDLEEYCNNKGWGYESFRKVFYHKMGLSPGQYIIQRRMDEACRLLRIGDLSVKETAIKLGYKSPYEFSAQFRRYTGWSPSDYRGAQSQGDI